VNIFNEEISKRLPGPERIYISLDRIMTNNPFSTLTNIAASSTTLEYVHTMSPGNMPPHKLILRAGSIVMLTRNLSLAEGLCNGTRLQVLRMFDEMLECRILTGPKAGKTTFINKSRFEHGMKKKDKGVAFSRLQFPIRLAFAMSINKAQGMLDLQLALTHQLPLGQTLARVGLGLITQQVFAHGWTTSPSLACARSMASGFSRSQKTSRLAQLRTWCGPSCWMIYQALQVCYTLLLS